MAGPLTFARSLWGALFGQRHLRVVGKFRPQRVNRAIAGNQSAIRAERRLWRKASNREVVSCAQPDCRRCKGQGIRWSWFTRRPRACACAVREYQRRNLGAMKHHGRGNVMVRAKQ